MSLTRCIISSHYYRKWKSNAHNNYRTFNNSPHSDELQQRHIFIALKNYTRSNNSKRGTKNMSEYYLRIAIFFISALRALKYQPQMGSLTSVLSLWVLSEYPMSMKTPHIQWPVRYHCYEESRLSVCVYDEYIQLPS